MCFTVQLSKIIFRIAVCLKQLRYYIMLFSACQEVFSTFLKLFSFLSCSNSDILSHPTGCCQELFLFLFDSFVISVRSLRRNSDRIPPLAGFVNKFFEIFLIIYLFSDSYSYRTKDRPGRFPYFLPSCFFYIYITRCINYHTQY